MDTAPIVWVDWAVVSLVRGGLFHDQGLSGGITDSDFIFAGFEDCVKLRVSDLFIFEGADTAPFFDCFYYFVHIFHLFI